MRTAGIDIGSRRIKFAVVKDGAALLYHGAETTFNPLEQCRALLQQNPADRIIATGYGRHLLEVHGDIRTITEIKAFARGARALFCRCRAIIDIGGQDTKVISLNEAGQVTKFEMNDRCAAGTGRFLEIMARTLGFSIEDFGALPFNGEKEIQLSNMCTVFAESEVVSLISRGVNRQEIAAAIHHSVASRVAAMAKRLPLEEDIVFAGGCAYNIALKEKLEQSLGKKLHVATSPEMTGALGAALYAADAVSNHA